MFKNVCDIFLFLVLFCCLFNSAFLAQEFRLKFKIGKNKDLNEENLIRYYLNHRLSSEICIGTPKQCLNLTLSFRAYNIWICGNDHLGSQFFPKMSSSFNDLFDEQKTQKIIGTSKGPLVSTKVQDIFEVCNINQKLCFYLVEDMDCFSDGYGEIGLNKVDLLDNVPQNVSLIEQLNIERIINTRIIRIKYINETSGEIDLGSSYSNIDKGANFVDVPMTEYDNTLSDYVKSISIINTHYNMINYNEPTEIKLKLSSKFRINFVFDSSFIQIPEQIFAQVKKISFDKYLNSAICSIKNDKENNIKYILCKDTILNTKLDSLLISFGEKGKLQINYRRLFLEVKNNMLIFGVVSSPNLNYLKFGDIFLSKFLCFLDNDKNIMRIYQNKNNLENEVQNIFGVKWLFGIGFVTVLLLLNLLRNICSQSGIEINNQDNEEQFIRNFK